ncbi:MAG: hypothetical protein HQK66_06135 [Desulfamplus sp.]|nr:hypothetical protein [Desulfamplus sp.]
MGKKKRDIDSLLADAEKFFKRGNFQLAERDFEIVQKTLERDDIQEKLEICKRENSAARAKELIKKANRAYSKGDLENALENFREARRLQMEPEPWLVEKIESLENEHLVERTDDNASREESRGNFKEAASLYAVAAQKMDDPGLWLKSASCLVRAGDYTGAMDIFNRLFLSPDVHESDSPHSDSPHSDSPYSDSPHSDSLYPNSLHKETGSRYIYDYGFTLAKMGKYIDALNVWQNIPDGNELFLNQKKRVFSLALSQNQRTMAHIQPAVAQSQTAVAQSQPAMAQIQPAMAQMGVDIWKAATNADVLHIHAKELGSERERECLGDIISHLKCWCIEDAWKRGDFPTASKLINQILSIPGRNRQERFDTGQKRMKFLSLKARASFHFAKDDPGAFKEMASSWLTVIYDLETARGLSSDPVVRGKVQQRLIKMAEAVVSSRSHTKEGRQAARKFSFEKSLMADLMDVAAKSGRIESYGNSISGRIESHGNSISGRIESHENPIFTPEYAALNGIAGDVLEFIVKHQDAFRNTVHYLETGGCYCTAWEPLYLMRIGEKEMAMKTLDSMPDQLFSDQFSRYVRQRVCFDYGQYAIARNRKDFMKYFNETHLFFKEHPSIEEEFREFLLDLHDGDELQKYEQAVSLIHKKHPSQGMAKSLSYLMTNSLLARDQAGMMQKNVVKRVARDALGLDPDNEYAAQLYSTIEIAEESEEMMKALNKRKFAKAAKIVDSSAHPEVRAHYFEAVETFFDQTEHALHTDDDPEFVTVLLQEMYQWAQYVDPFHEVTGRMEALLNKIKQ